MTWEKLLTEAMADFQDESTEDVSSRGYLKSLCERLKRGDSPKSVYAYLETDLPRLLEEEAREDEHYTFDWYDDHHYQRIYLGQIYACRRAMRLYEQADDTEN